MQSAIKEIMRRKKIQRDYNKKHGISPKPISKKIKDWPFAAKDPDNEIGPFNKEINAAARNFDFERVANIRGLIKNIKDGKR